MAAIIGLFFRIARQEGVGTVSYTHLDRRAGDGAPEEGGRGGLCALCFGLPPVQGHQHLYAGAQQTAEGQIRMDDLTGKTGRCPNKREKREPKDQP